ncbi:hypothetical protein VTO73DRAFT_12953 [Trametes versicolor]
MMSSAGTQFVDFTPFCDPALLYAIKNMTEIGQVLDWMHSLPETLPPSFPARWLPVFGEVLFHLDVADVVRMRRVCKSIYYASHTRALWAYLLRKSDPASLPPLPPVSEIGPLEQGVPASLSALAIERIVVRGASLRANFACPHPRPFRIWAQETFAYVQDVALLPGSDHLVAIQQDMTTKVSSMVLYKLDCAHDAEAMAAVPLSGQPVIGTLQAKYMTVNGVLGLTVACIQKIRDPTCGLVEYECRAAHLCPETMEQLATVYPPDSPRYLWLSETLPAACTSIAMPVPSRAPSRALTLGMIANTPCVAFARETGPCRNEIWIQSLEGGCGAMMQVAPTVVEDPQYANAEWRIRSLRILPEQQSVLAISHYVVPSLYDTMFAPIPLSHRIDVFPVSLPGVAHVAPSSSNPGARIHHLASSAHEVRVTDPALPVPAQNSIYAAAGLAHDTCAPIMDVFVHSILEKRTTDASAAPLPTVGPAVSHFPVLDANCLGITPDNVRILPGARNPLLYKVAQGKLDMLPVEADVAPGERMEGLHALRGDVTTVEVQGVVERLGWNGGDTTVGAVAWDDTVGRLVIAHPERTSFRVFDFAKIPKLDAHGDRWPLPVIRNA